MTRHFRKSWSHPFLTFQQKVILDINPRVKMLILRWVSDSYAEWCKHYAIEGEESGPRGLPSRCSDSQDLGPTKSYRVRYSDSRTFNRANSSITVITLDRAISHDSACYHSKEDFSLYIIMCSPFQESEDLRLIHIWAWNSLSDHMRHMFRPFFVNGRTRVTWLY